MRINIWPVQLFVYSVQQYSIQCVMLPRVEHRRIIEARDIRIDEENADCVRPLKKPNLFRTRDTGFRKQEILERANLFKNEYDQDGISDKVLVLLVMPDDYEIRELTARLQLDECTGTAVLNRPEICLGESSSEKSLKCGAKIVNVEDRALLNPGDAWCTSPNAGSLSQPTPVRTMKDDRSVVSMNSSCENTDINTSGSGVNVGIQTKRHNGLITSPKKSKAKNDMHSWPNTSLDSKTTNKTDYDLEHAYDDRTPKHKIKSTKMSESFSMYERPIPPPRSFFQELSHELWERENKDDAIVSVITPSRNEPMKPELEIAECERELEARDAIASESIGLKSESALESDSEDSSSACDFDALREHRIHVHSSWLAVNSSYFRSLLFESRMKECTGAEFCMKVTKSEENAFLFLLKSIYDPDVLDTVQISELMTVLRLSVKFDVRFSLMKAKRVLEVRPLTLEICETIIEAVYNSGGLPDLGEVMKNVEERLLGEFEPLDDTWESEKFASLSECALRFVLGSDRLIVQSENTVFIALMHWIVTNAELNSRDVAEYSDLVNLVRFENMEPTYIHDVVRAHEVARKLHDFEMVYLKAITYHALPPKRRESNQQPRKWCEPKFPTFMWILYLEPEMFPFEVGAVSSSTKSSSFWFFGYKMHVELVLSSSQDKSSLYLVIENLAKDGSLEIAYTADVKFGEGLHNSFTCGPFVYRGNDISLYPGNFPFNNQYSLGEIKELLFGSSVPVPITFEITLDKILYD